jgi:vitamin B12 transporter
MPFNLRGAVLASLSLAACAQLHCAATLAAGAEPLSEVVITATRTATGPSQLAVPVIVITRREIEDALASDVTGLLASRPGLEIARSGGAGQPASLFMRGTESNHTAVLVDGVRINPGTIGGAALQNVLPESVERIEIVKGPRSALYGSDAIGGVVNIITRAGAARGANLFTSAGHYGTSSAAADGGIALGERAGLGGSITWRDSDGFAPRAASKSRGAFRDAVGNLQIQARPSDALALRASGWRSAGRVYYDDFGSQGIEDFATASYAASADWQAADSASYRAALNRAEDLIDLKQSPDYAHTRRDGLELQGNWLVAGGHRLSAGALLSDERTAALSFGTRFDVATRAQQYFLQDQLQRGAHSLLLAGGHAQHQTFGGHDTWNAEYAAHVGAWRLRAAAGTGFHAPDSTDRFGFGGNPSLQPETSRQFDLGVDWQPDASQQIQVDAFDNHIDNLVDYVVTNFVTFAGRNQNVARTRIRGVEATYQLSLQAWTLRAGGSWQDPRNLTDGKQLLRRARQNFSLASQYRLASLSVGGELLYVGRRLDAGFPSSVALPGHALLALTAHYDITRDWSLQLRVDNALDRRYQEINGYNTARRGVTLATRLRLH